MSIIAEEGVVDNSGTLEGREHQPQQEAQLHTIVERDATYTKKLIVCFTLIGSY